MSEPRVLVTGASGYIGGAITGALLARGDAVLAGVRRLAGLPAGATALVTGDLADADPVLENVRAVVHAAGLGHRRGVTAAVWRRANVDAPVRLARAAKAAGVARFVLISTAHVHGRAPDGVVRDDTPANPMDGYAESKVVAEREVAAIFGAGLTIIRPVAVIGPHCPGNLALVMTLLRRRVPLPFGAIVNQRAFIARDDLARLVLAVLAAAAPPVLVLAAHPAPIATPALIRALAAGMGVRPRLLACPPALLATAAGIAGRGAMWQSLAGSFVADPAAAATLGWAPAEPLRESLVKTGAAFAVS